LSGILLRPMAVASVSDSDPLARRALESANLLLSEPSNTLRSRVLSRLSWMPPYSHDREKRLEMSMKARELAHPSYPRSQFDALAALHLAQSAPVDLPRALEDRGRRVSVLVGIRGLLPRDSRAIQQLELAVETNERIGHRPQLARSRLALGELLTLQSSRAAHPRGIELLRRVHDEARDAGLTITLRSVEMALLKAGQTLPALA